MTVTEIELPLQDMKKALELLIRMTREHNTEPMTGGDDCHDAQCFFCNAQEGKPHSHNCAWQESKEFISSLGVKCK